MWPVEKVSGRKDDLSEVIVVNRKDSNLQKSEKTCNPHPSFCSQVPCLQHDWIGQKIAPWAVVLLALSYRTKIYG
jgi:hypothetical protein